MHRSSSAGKQIHLAAPAFAWPAGNSWGMLLWPRQTPTRGERRGRGLPSLSSANHEEGSRGPRSFAGIASGHLPRRRLLLLVRPLRHFELWLPGQDLRLPEVDALLRSLLRRVQFGLQLWRLRPRLWRLRRRNGRWPVVFLLAARSPLPGPGPNRLSILAVAHGFDHGDRCLPDRGLFRTGPELLVRPLIDRGCVRRVRLGRWAMPAATVGPSSFQASSICNGRRLPTRHCSTKFDLPVNRLPCRVPRRSSSASTARSSAGLSRHHWGATR
jgi:hypothetical protein